MAAGEQEFVIAPWNTGEHETELCTLTLPSRDCIVQIEVPVWIANRMRKQGEERSVSMQRLLAEKLEYNMAELLVLKARHVRGLDETKTQLVEALEYLSCLDILDTAALEAEIETVWAAELE